MVVLLIRHDPTGLGWVAPPIKDLELSGMHVQLSNRGM